MLADFDPVVKILHEAAARGRALRLRRAARTHRNSVDQVNDDDSGQVSKIVMNLTLHEEENAL